MNEVRFRHLLTCIGWGFLLVGFTVEGATRIAFDGIAAGFFSSSLLAWAISWVADP